jgi:hypothetical protein
MSDHHRYPTVPAGVQVIVSIHLLFVDDRHI